MKLGDIAKVYGGYAFKSSEFKENGTPIIRIGNLDGDIVNLDDSICYSEDFLIKHPEFIVNKGDILVAMSGATVGKIGVYKNDLKALLNQRVGNIKPIGNLNKKLIFYYCKSPSFMNHIKKEAFGCAQPNISSSKIEDFVLNLPSEEKQNMVVEVLDKASKSIELKKLQLSAYDQLIKSRFVEMFGDPTQNNGSWNNDRLGNLLTIVRGASPRPIQSFISEDKNGINWIKIGDTSKDSMFITSTKEKIKPEGVAKSRFVKEGDFLLSNSMSFGRPYILKTSGCVHDGWLVLSNYETSFNKYFLYSLLNSEAVYNKFKSIVVGGVVNNLNSEMVRNLKVIIPPMDMQIKFSEILGQVDKLKFVVQKSLDETRKLFNSLMQEYFG